MILTINFMMYLLFIIYLVFTWKSTKGFGGVQTRVLYMVIGTAFIALLTFFFFLYSSIGVEYPKEEMIGVVRSKILLIFIPLNGFIVLPQIASLIGKIKDGEALKEDVQKKMRVIIIVCAILIVFECIYFKNIQNGIINFLSSLESGKN